MDLLIKPLSAELLGDYLHFFDNIAFTDNTDWAGCYCYYYHWGKSRAEWLEQTGEKNCKNVSEMIMHGKMKGYLAYVDGKPAGWCNANDKGNYDRLMVTPDINDGDVDRICSIVCFIIAPEYWRKGIATALLQRICDDYTDKGYTYVEAYPRKGDLSCALHYHGPMSMYQNAGFTVYKSFSEFDIVRKKL